MFFAIVAKTLWRIVKGLPIRSATNNKFSAGLPIYSDTPMHTVDRRQHRKIYWRYSELTVLLSCCPILVSNSWLPCPSWLTCLSCPVLSWLSFPVLSVLSWQSILAFLYYQSCPHYPILAFLSWLSFPGCLVLAVFTWLSYPIFLSWLSCSGCPVLAVMFVLSCSAVLFLLSWSCCPTWLS